MTLNLNRDSAVVNVSMSILRQSDVLTGKMPETNANNPINSVPVSSFPQCYMPPGGDH